MGGRTGNWVEHTIKQICEIAPNTSNSPTIITRHCQLKVFCMQSRQWKTICGHATGATTTGFDSTKVAGGWGRQITTIMTCFNRSYSLRFLKPCDSTFQKTPAPSPPHPHSLLANPHICGVCFQIIPPEVFEGIWSGHRTNFSPGHKASHHHKLTQQRVNPNISSLTITPLRWENTSITAI